MISKLLGATSAVLAFSMASALLRETNPSGVCGTTKQYAGYFEIDPSTDKHYFYWAMESRNDPSNDPVILWMTGGPGCSSELALMGENGPCKVNPDLSTSNNAYSWNNNANLIYIDQPAGTGFSYSNYDGYSTNEKEVADDMYIFLQDFFQAHPEWQNNEFYVFGESYGGHFVPATSHRVFIGNKNSEGLHINLKGVSVGNGLTDPLVQYKFYSTMAYNYSISRLGHPVISESAYESMVSAWPTCQSLIAQCQSDTSACAEAQSYCNNAMLGPYEQTGLNPYDIRKPCEVPPLCYNFTAVTTYLDSAFVRQQLGVGNRKWSVCNFEVNGLFSDDWMKDYQQDIPDMLESGIRIQIYAGDVDFICNWIGNKAWVLDLTWTGKAAFNAAQDKSWYVSGQSQPAGLIREYNGLSFVQVHNAGHMVPKDQPQAALEMVNRFISNQPLTG